MGQQVFLSRGVVRAGLQHEKAGSVEQFAFFSSWLLKHCAKRAHQAAPLARNKAWAGRVPCDDQSGRQNLSISRPKTKRFMLAIGFSAIGLLSNRGYAQPHEDIKEYAKQCMSELSGRNGKIDFPDKLQCNEGDLLPITLGNIPIPADEDKDSRNFDEKTECDRPPLLGLGGSIGQCVPNSRLKVTQVQQGNVATKVRPYYALLCRNYRFRSEKSQKDNPKFDDIAMIVYSPINKTTCFFQRFARAADRGVPQKLSAFSPVKELPGENIASPFSNDAEKFWDGPDVVNRINCAECHSANPFIRSAYANQVMTDSKNKLPTRAFGEPYNIFYLDKFSEKWKEFHGYFNFAESERKNGERGACMRCHSLGIGPSSMFFSQNSAGLLAPNQFDTQDFAVSHWMPPSAKKDTWENDFKKSIDAYVTCVNYPNNVDCNLIKLSSAPPPPSSTTSSAPPATP